MTKVPLKWKKVDSDGKVEINGEDNSTFTSASPAFKVNGDETLTGNLSVGGNETLTGDFSVGGDETVTGDLVVNGTSGTNKVGINVASPSEVLDVNGNGKISGTLSVGSTAAVASNLTVGGKITTVGVSTSGAIEMNGNDIQLNTSGSSSDDSSNIVWYYGNGREKARLWTDSSYTAAKGLNYRVYKSDGTSLLSGSIPTADTNTTYTIATGDNNGQIKVTPSSGSAYNVGVKGLGSAAYKNYAEANTASTVVARNANGYIYATYYNASCGNETTTYDSTSGFNIYCNSDGWLRKAKAVTQLYSGSLAPTGQCSWANYKAYSKYLVIASLEGGNATTTTIVPRNTFTSSRQASSSYIIADDAYWCVCYMWYSGTTGYLYMEAGRSDCRIKYVFGLN